MYRFLTEKTNSYKIQMDLKKIIYLLRKRIICGMIAQRKAENFMIEHTFTFSSFQDQLTIHCLIEIPENPCGILQIVHGMSEHKERYLPFMEAMAKSGWICVIHDHRGHGESVKTKEDLGYFYDTTGTYLMEDVHQLTYLMKQRFPTLPYVLFGHSMGSLLARAYTKKYDYEWFDYLRISQQKPYGMDGKHCGEINGKMETCAISKPHDSTSCILQK